MSTEWYYRCLSHDPPMCGYPDDMGNPSRTDMGKALTLRDAIRSIPASVWEEYQFEFPSHVRWVHSHPRCALEMVSEYGEVQARIEASSERP